MYKEKPWYSRIKSLFRLTLGEKICIVLNFKGKNQYVLIKSVWVAGLLTITSVFSPQPPPCSSRPGEADRTSDSCWPAPPCRSQRAAAVEREDDKGTSLAVHQNNKLRSLRLASKSWNAHYINQSYRHKNSSSILISQGQVYNPW